MKISGKVFVVTGAGGGIGSELVRGLLLRGAEVVAVDVNGEALRRLKKSVGEARSRLSLNTVDITDRLAVAALPGSVLSTYQGVDGLINCAGIIQPFVKVQDMDYATIDRIMQTNFYGTLYMTKAFLPLLMQRPEAQLVNVSSMGGFISVPGQSVYGASKAAVKLLTEGLYAELLGTNVHVIAVFPGATETDISKNSGVFAPVVTPQQAHKIPMLSPATAASLIIRGMEKNKPQIYTGKDSRAMSIFYRLAPVRATSFIAHRMRSLLE